jgi:D-aminopeptidase
MRARELGVEVGTGVPGPGDAITDVAGVRVGHATLIEGGGRCWSAGGRCAPASP